MAPKTIDVELRLKDIDSRVTLSDLVRNADGLGLTLHVLLVPKKRMAVVAPAADPPKKKRRK